MLEKMTSHSIIDQLRQDLQECRICLDAGYTISPGAVFSHPQKADVLLIGQAPGITEVTAKRPFNAGSGQRLFQWLNRAGWEEGDFRENYTMTAVTKCYPGKGKNGKGDRVPSKKEQQLCRPYLEREMTIFNPRLIIPVGGLAIKLFFASSLKLNEVIGTAIYLPGRLKIDPFKQSKSRGKVCRAYDRTLDQDGRWIVPLPHPSGASLWPNKPENKALITQGLKLLSDIRINWGL